MIYAHMLKRFLNLSFQSFKSYILEPTHPGHHTGTCISPMEVNSATPQQIFTLSMSNAIKEDLENVGQIALKLHVNLEAREHSKRRKTLA